MVTGTGALQHPPSVSLGFLRGVDEGALGGVLVVLEVARHGLVVQRVDGYAPVLAQLEVDVRAGRARQRCRWVAARADGGARAGEERRDLRALWDEAVVDRERRRGDERRGGGQEGSASGHCEAET